MAVYKTWVPYVLLAQCLAHGTLCWNGPGCARGHTRSCRSGMRTCVPGLGHMLPPPPCVPNSKPALACFSAQPSAFPGEGAVCLEFSPTPKTFPLLGNRLPFCQSKPEQARVPCFLQTWSFSGKKNQTKGKYAQTADLLNLLHKLHSPKKATGASPKEVTS